jgi:hypothetical protein
MYRSHIILDNFSMEQLERLISNAWKISEIGERIDFLSKQFLGIDYAESTLIGDKDTPEVFVINLDGVDCLTFIEYVEAMRLSGSYSGFESNLKKIRYRSGIVDFMSRNHFFSDWEEFNPEFVEDLTKKIGGENTIKTQKTLNEKEDGRYFLPGIPPVRKEIKYIPSDAIDGLILEKLMTGDYIGIYSSLKGLDVSHVGIIIKDVNTVYFRHASSHKEIRKVVDQDFKSYIVSKPGIIVFRPRFPNPK